MAPACPSNPAPPTGYAVWQGRVPPELTAWAIQIRDGINKFPYGTTWTRDWKGLPVLARKDYHTWTYVNGQLVSGICIPGVTLYQPLADRVLFTFDEDQAQAAGAKFDTTGILISGAALIGVVGAFFLALRYAGRP